MHKKKYTLIRDGFFDPDFFESFDLKTYEAKKISTIIKIRVQKPADLLVVNAKLGISFYANKRTN